MSSKSAQWEFINGFFFRNAAVVGQWNIDILISPLIDVSVDGINTRVSSPLYGRPQYDHGCLQDVVMKCTRETCACCRRVPTRLQIV